MINYEIISESIRFYKAKGYSRVETPWTVPNEIMSITYPLEKDKNPFYLPGKDKSLVASGEQSFLSQYNKGFLPLGKFQTVTPCFRNETFDETHTKYFIKNELIITGVEDTEEELQKIIKDAYGFFSRFLLSEKLSVIKNGDFSYDIFYYDVEIGSYGYRECSFLKWIYGTGVAEPRFSRSMRGL